MRQRLGNKSVEKDAAVLDVILGRRYATQGLAGEHTWGRIVLIYPDSTIAKTYVKSAANLVQAVEVDAIYGSMVWVPPALYATELSIPAGVGVASMGNKAVIAGKVSYGGIGTHTKGIMVRVIGSSSDPIIAVDGPPEDAGEAIINDCWIIAINEGEGNAYAVSTGPGGDLFVFNTLLYAEASGGGDGYAGLYSGGDLTQVGGRAWGSTDRYTAG